LKSGIGRSREEAAEAGSQPAALIAAKVSLAQIQVSKGNYPEAIRLLTEKPHAPIEAIAVNDESTRPAEGIQGRPFAGLVYQLLLRAYVGAQQIDEALSAMKGLESIAGGRRRECRGGLRVARTRDSEGN
jgi:hypothetical protein